MKSLLITISQHSAASRLLSKAELSHSSPLNYGTTPPVVQLCKDELPGVGLSDPGALRHTPEHILNSFATSHEAGKDFKTTGNQTPEVFTSYNSNSTTLEYPSPPPNDPRPPQQVAGVIPHSVPICSTTFDVPHTVQQSILSPIPQFSSNSPAPAIPLQQATLSPLSPFTATDTSSLSPTPPTPFFGGGIGYNCSFTGSETGVDTSIGGSSMLQAHLPSTVDDLQHYLMHAQSFSTQSDLLTMPSTLAGIYSNGAYPPSSEVTSRVMDGVFLGTPMTADDALLDKTEQLMSWAA